MDSVFDAQFRNLRDAFADRGVDVRVAYRPDGEVDYVYQAGRLLTRRGDVRASRDNLEQVLPGIEPVAEEESRLSGDVLGQLQQWSIATLRDGRLTVPEAMDIVDRRLLRGEPYGAGNEAAGPTLPVATPVHVVHVTGFRMCPAVEASVPSGYPTEPWPAARPSVPSARRVRVGVSDTGLLAGADVAHPWLAGVTGEPDELGPLLPNGRHLIPEYTGHGTFIAGVIRSVAPDTDVHVVDHFPASGAWLEHEVVAGIERLAADFAPDVISLSAGSYTRDGWEPLTFSAFHERYPDITLVAAAGNDSTDRPFYPAAYDWAIGVGALATDQEHPAWFTNSGPWVDVYALGEGMVNAYASGVYEYQEPPRRPHRQTFTGMARWDGTSFATPLVAGLIAARMSEHPEESAWQAARALLAAAREVEGIGRVLTV